MRIRLRNTGLDAELWDRESCDIIGPAPRSKWEFPPDKFTIRWAPVFGIFRRQS